MTAQRQPRTPGEICALLVDVAGKTANCLDFDLTYWLAQYERYLADPNFPEAAILIRSAGKIYGRKVEYLERTLLCMDSDMDEALAPDVPPEINSDAEKEPQKDPPAEVKTPDKIEKLKKKRPIPLFDVVTHAENVAKKIFSLAPMARLTEHIIKIKSTKSLKSDEEKNADCREAIAKSRVELLQLWDLTTTSNENDAQQSNMPSFFDLMISCDDITNHMKASSRFNKTNKNCIEEEYKNFVGELSSLAKDHFEKLLDAVINLDVHDLDRDPQLLVIKALESLPKADPLIPSIDVPENTESSITTLNEPEISSTNVPLEDENIKINDIDYMNATIRDSIDEGISVSSACEPATSFSIADLETLDWKLYSPHVELVDILKPINTKADNLSFDLSGMMMNIFSIDNSYLQFYENFMLPEYFLLNAIPLVCNYLKLPEKKLRKPKHFQLPIEYTAAKKLKRESSDNVRNVTVKIRRLNNAEFNKNLAPDTDEEDFLGYDDFDTNRSFGGMLSSTLINNSVLDTPKSITNRSFSSDSGNDCSGIANSIAYDSGFQSMSDSELTLSPSTSQIARCDRSLEDSSSCFIADAAHLSNCSIPEIFECFKDKDMAELENWWRLKRRELSDTTADERRLMDVRVNKWHDYLKPILLESRKRSFFNIFEYGSKILDCFPQSDTSSHSLHFSDVMKKEDPSCTARYFLSMLQLANTFNIDISVAQGNNHQVTALEEIHLKLLSHKRYETPAENQENYDEAFFEDSDDDDAISQAKRARLDGDGCNTVVENLIADPKSLQLVIHKELVKSFIKKRSIRERPRAPSIEPAVITKELSSQVPR